MGLPSTWQKEYVFHPSRIWNQQWTELRQQGRHLCRTVGPQLGRVVSKCLPNYYTDAEGIFQLMVLLEQGLFPNLTLVTFLCVCVSEFWIALTSLNVEIWHDCFSRKKWIYYCCTSHLYNYKVGRDFVKVSCNEASYNLICLINWYYCIKKREAEGESLKGQEEHVQ